MCEIQLVVDSSKIGTQVGTVITEGIGSKLQCIASVRVTYIILTFMVFPAEGYHLAKNQLPGILS